MDDPSPQDPMDPRAKRALFWLYLAMAIGMILPVVLYFIFGTSE